MLRIGHISAIGCVLFAISGTAFASSAQSIPDARQAVLFETRVRPVLVERCYPCHAGSIAKGGLRLDSRAAMLAGGNREPAVSLEGPDSSLLLRAVRYTDKNLRMPPGGPLASDQIAAITEWVKAGAPWPAATTAKRPGGRFDLRARRAAHWAWQPVSARPLPTVRNLAWARNPVDRFILARLEASGLKPAPPADRLTLLRRVTFDLIGLPPTPEEIESFLRDTSPRAYEKVVDRLLASPHYGERWARHWLDIVRFGETDGHEFDTDKPGAFRYRDYVIRAFNADLPYNDFVKEHVAGDLMPNPRRNSADGANESVIGTGFWWLGEASHSPVDVTQEQRTILDNQVDVFGKAFLGLTVGCARCHDHKFDALSTKDYYALTGYLKSSRYHLAAIDPADTNREVVEQLTDVRRALGQRVNATPQLDTPQLPGSIVFKDFARQGFDGWDRTGEAFGEEPHDLLTAARNSQGVLRVGRTAGPVADSGWLSDRLQGTLRSPTFTIDTPYILTRVAGHGGARLNVIIDGYQKIRDPIYGGLTIAPSDPSRLQWRVQDVSKWVGHRAYIELIDYGTGRIACGQILFSDTSDTPERRGTPFRDIDSADSHRNDDISRLVAQREDLESRLVEPTRVLALTDGTGENDFIHIRGSHLSLGDEAPRRFLEACGGDTRADISVTGSGRLALAERVISPSNPLLARVIVNRVWQHHFGEGIVRSVDDFGVMGQPPTHPELLDWLAGQFVAKWSLKALHRLMVTSNAYRVSSRPDSRALKVDPTNRLLHHIPVRRLEAEAVRDSVLAVSGRLDRTMYGPSVMPSLTPFMEGRGRPEQSGPLDGNGRRSSYINVRRNFLPPLFLAFDFPVPATCMGRRSVSNVPAQALTMMNNPFVVQQAAVWAKRILALPGTESERIRQMYLSAFGRPPTATEAMAAARFLDSQRGQPAPDESRAWADLCHVLFNVKEFIFVH